MKIKKQIQHRLTGTVPKHILETIPAGYAVTGDVAIIRFIKMDIKYKQLIGQSIIELDPKVNVVIEQKDTLTQYRTPKIIHIAGEKRTTTIHKEFSTVFKIDLNRLTFSPGNTGERERMINIVASNEIICDMFACIGNLSLPIIVNNPSVKCYGIEKNPYAYNILKENIRLNNVNKRYIPILGDNNVKTPRLFANRVIMGYFKISKNQVQRAFFALKERGYIHFHVLIPRGDTEKAINNIRKWITDINGKIREIETRVVKKYSPRLIHSCIDIFLEKTAI